MKFSEKLNAILEGEWDPEGPWEPTEWELVKIVGDGKLGVLKSNVVPPQFYGGPVSHEGDRWLPVSDDRHNYFQTWSEAESHAESLWLNTPTAASVVPTSAPAPMEFGARLGEALELASKST